MKVNIKGKEIELRITMRSYVMYESINDGKMFNPTTLTEMITYFYSVVCGSDKTLQISFSEFLDWMDENEGCLTEFTEWLKGVNNQDMQRKKKTGGKKVSK